MKSCSIFYNNDGSQVEAVLLHSGNGLTNFNNCLLLIMTDGQKGGQVQVP